VVVENVQCIADDTLDQGHLIVGELVELPFAPSLRELALVCRINMTRFLGEAIRHFDGIHDSVDHLVMAVQIIDLARQILFDSPPYA